MVNHSFISSAGQFCPTPFATLTKVSKPTRSDVLNVADLGLPETGPVTLSIASMLRPCLTIILKIAMILKTPILLAINAGVSFAFTVVLPRKRSP